MSQLFGFKHGAIQYKVFNNDLNKECFITGSWKKVLDHVTKMSGTCFSINGKTRINHSKNDFGMDVYNKQAS